MKLHGFQTPILCAMVGFIYSICLITCNSSPSGSAFREIRITGHKEIVLGLLTQKKAAFEKSLGILRDQLKDSNQCPDTKPGICKEKSDSVISLRADIKSLETTLYNLEYNNGDTNAIYYSRYINANHSKLDSVLKTFKGSATISVNANEKYIKLDSARVTLVEAPAEKLVSYADKNPLTGYWFLITIAQASLWFLTAQLLIGNLRDIEKKYYRSKWEGIGMSFFVTAVVVLLFVGFFYYKLMDIRVISDHVFLENFGNKIFAYAVPGYIVATICFSIFICAAVKLDAFDNSALKNLQNDKIEFDQLKSMFNSAFIASAVILSFFIVWIGVLFNAINDLDTMRFYKQMTGHPYMNNDFVYMIALLHTLLLLIFYIPVKLKFESMQVSQTAATTGWKKWVSLLFECLGTILVTASPLITGLISKIITGLSQ